MKQYKIYENHLLGHREAIKQGWSWPAFFFNWIWAFLNKMNAIGAAVLGGFIFVGFLSGIAGDEGAEALDGLVGLASIAVAVVFGVNGNAWRERNLLSRGYEFKGTTEADCGESALALYMKRAQQANPGMA